MTNENPKEKIPPPGFPGYRNQPGRSGLDYIDTYREYAHMEGKFLRYLFTFRLRTRNPFYLGAMLIVGLAALLPMVAIVAENAKHTPLIFCFGLPFISIGIALLGNFLINLNWIIGGESNALEDEAIEKVAHRKRPRIRRKIRYPERKK